MVVLITLQAGHKVIVAECVILVPIVDIVYAYHCERKRNFELESALYQGANDVEGINQKQFFERPAITPATGKLLNPAMWHHGYYLIIGSTGKTSLVRTIEHPLSGIIYADIHPTWQDFDFALIKALRWTPPTTSWSMMLINNLLNRNILDPYK